MRPPPGFFRSMVYAHRLSRTVLSLHLALIVCTLGCENQLIEDGHEHDAVSFSADGDQLFEQLKAEADGWFVTDPMAASEAFNRVGVMFDAETPVEMQARASDTDAASWSDWSDLEVVFNEEHAHNAMVDIDGQTHIQLRVRAPVEAGLRFLSLMAFNAEGEGSALEAGQAQQALLRDRENVVSRSGWGARSSRCGSSSHTPNRITIHHTETPNNPNVSDSARMRQMQAFHMDSRGWCDIGYHLLIGADGRIYQGRPENRRGAHAGAGNNTNNVGISFIGSFQSRLPNAAQLDAGARAVRGVASEWGITLNRTRVKGHREMRSTDCPGQALYNFLPDLVQMARDGSSAPEPPQQSDANCNSQTLGHPVSSGDFVQVSYDACGQDSCAWFQCNDGSWSCASEASGNGAHPNPSCAPVTTPDDPSDIILMDTFPAVVEGDTRASGRDNFDRYSCAPGTNESGPEQVYEVRIAEAGVFAVEVDDDGQTDIDLQLLTSLDSSACLTRHDTRIQVRLDPGTYYLVADSYVTSSGTERAGSYTLRATLTPVPSDGECAMLDTELEMFWSSCAGSVDNCESNQGRRYLRLPATGPVVKEAHLVTTSESFSSGWPTSFTNGIQNHYTVSEQVSGYDMNRSEPWAPAGEGGSRFGQGSTGSPIPVRDEAFYITMHWRNRPAGGTRMIVMNPDNGRAVVASAGWETGPGANTSIAGVSEEIHHHLGTSHLSDLTVGFAANTSLPLGPITCTSTTTPDAPNPDPIGSYSDVDEDHPAFAAAEALRAAGALWGCAPGSFCPDSPLTRDVFANIISTLEDSDVSLPSSPAFGDVGPTHWAFAAVQELSARNITYGCGGGNFCPSNEVSRASFAVYLRRAFGLSGMSASSFSDVTSAHWASSSIEAAAQAGLVDGCGGGLYCPDDSITRGEAARMLAAAYDVE